MKKKMKKNFFSIPNLSYYFDYFQQKIENLLNTFW